MRRKKSPAIKKQDSYDKDHRTQMENRRDRVALRSAMASDSLEELTPKAVARIREKDPVIKSGVSTLRKSIKVKRQKRLRDLLNRINGPSPYGELLNDRPRGRELI